MGKINSRQKGARFERTIAHMLREHGFEAERGVQHQGGKDSPDVKCNLLNTHIEAKNVEALNIWNALAQSERDAGESEMPIVIFKRNRSKVYVAMGFEDYIALYKAWESRQADGLLKHAIAIRDFLTDKGCSSTQYWDEDGNEIMHTDIGYFDEGLDELIEYLQGKEKQDNG